ncbi:MAG: hypothetical protein WBA07_21855 [Rivularia sp. (in: cyanobacteria)]
MTQWYEELFENYAIKYDNESFTQGTIGECDFIEKEIEYNKEAKNFDIGCGTGRQCNERYYVPSEITWLLTTLNFQQIYLFGAKLGAFSRADKLSTEDYEILVIAEK